jgi:hypothetical protein
MGSYASTMSASAAPALFPLACLDLLASVDAAREAVLWPTVLVRESADGPGMPRRLTLSARTVPLRVP